MYKEKEFNFDNNYMTYINPEYTSLVSRKCKWCGRTVFLTKKDEFKYNMKRKGVI